jgi:hypothetical protein
MTEVALVIDAKVLFNHQAKGLELNPAVMCIDSGVAEVRLTASGRRLLMRLGAEVDQAPSHQVVIVRGEPAAKR